MEGSKQIVPEETSNLLPLLFRPPDKNAYLKIIFLISRPKHVVGAQKNRLD